MISPEVFGWVGGSVGAAVVWPQVWRLWVGRHHEGLSLSSSTLGVLYIAGWFAYGLTQHSPSMIVCNGVALLAAVAVLVGQLWLARPKAVGWLPLLTLGGAFLGATVAFGNDKVVGWTMAVATIGSIVVQVAAMVRQRISGDLDVRGVSRPRWWLGVFCNAMWVGYGVLAGDPVMLVSPGVGCLLSLVVLGLTIQPARASAVEPVVAEQSAR
ncbi:SemiSWEET family transporter [Longispora sp. K20-0274]|uniref:SemiSWEET family transporter n=1 Tax=Longispora sp. K20-0274 TaxID=3088255 RepID=UPI00399BAC70